MEIDDLEKRLNLMFKLAEYNEKIRQDYDKGLTAVLNGTQKVLDFLTKNSGEPETPPPQQQPSVDVIDFLADTNIPYVSTIAKGIDMIKQLPFIEPPIEPKNPKATQEAITTDDQIEVLRNVFSQICELRKMISDSMLGEDEKYQFELIIYKLQKYLWESIKKPLVCTNGLNKELNR